MPVVSTSLRFHMENKNFIVAILLSVAFLFIWSIFVVPRYAPKAPIKPPVSVPSSEQTAPSNAPTPATPAIEPAHRDVSAADTIFRDTQNEVMMTPLGAGIRHWRLVSKNQEVDLVLTPDAPTRPLETFPKTAFTVRQE